MIGCFIMLYRVGLVQDSIATGTQIVSSEFDKLYPCFDEYTRVNPKEYIETFNKMTSQSSAVLG